MSYGITNGNKFCVRHKNRQKHNQHFKLLFFTIINLHFVTSNQISTYRKVNLPLTSSIYLVFYLRKCKEDSNRPRYTTRFYFAWNETTHKPLKAAVRKTLFPVCMLLVKLVPMNHGTILIPCDNLKTLTILFMKVYRYSEVFSTAMLLVSLKPVFWKGSLFHALFPR